MKVRWHELHEIFKSFFRIVLLTQEQFRPSMISKITSLQISKKVTEKLC